MKKIESQMQTGAVVDKAELIKYWDVLDAIAYAARRLAYSDVLDKAMQLARQCRHEDAQWLAALFPPGVVLTRDHVRKVMVAQGEDRRALFVASLIMPLRGQDDTALLRRSAEMGFAPAQANMAEWLRYSNPIEALAWAQKAADQGDRNGQFELGTHPQGPWSSDRPRAAALLKLAAESGHVGAQVTYGELLAKHDGERYYWWGRAAAAAREKGLRCDAAKRLGSAAVVFLDSFEDGRMGRVLVTLAPAVRILLEYHVEPEIGKLKRVVAVYDSMLVRARQAIDCWSIVAQRHGVVKDIRVVIAKMAWAEVWAWNERPAAVSK